MVTTSEYKTLQELFGAPEPPKNGRERLVHAAIEFIYVHGFQALGVDQILARTGVSKTTFYKHFESRDDLLVAAIQTRDQWEMASFNAAVQKLAKDDPQAQLLAIFDVLDFWFNSPDYHGCQFINAASEFPNPHDPVHVVAADRKRKSREEFRDMAVAAGIADPETFADQYTALVEGTLVMRQIHGRNDAAKVIKPAVEMLLAQRLRSRSENDA